KSPVRDVREVEYYGQPIALVVAETFEQARDAAEHLDVTYSERPAALDPHAQDAEAEPQDGKSVIQGDLDRAMREAANAVDVTYRTEGHNSAPMEPHASLAQWDGERLTVHLSMQMLRYNVDELADALGMPP